MRDRIMLARIMLRFVRALFLPETGTETEADLLIVTAAELVKEPGWREQAG